MTKIYITENKDYTITITKKNSILSTDFYYIFNIYNNLNISILQFNITYSDILNIIDNIEEFLSNDTDIYYSVNNINDNTYIIGLYQSDIDCRLITKYEDFYNKDIFCISTYNNDTIFKIISFEVTNTLSDFLNILYKLIENEETP